MSLRIAARCGRQAALTLYLSCVFIGCTPQPEAIKPVEPAKRKAVELDPYEKPVLVDATAELNLRFRHDPGDTSDYAMPRIMGSGACVFDGDGDGDMDVLFINGQPTESDSGDRLFRQDADGKFTDVTSASGLRADGYGMGAVAGDVDNDGDVDLFLTRVGRSRLFLNNGDMTFQDVTEQCGIDCTQWATAASLFDYDRDGWLDLCVVNYVDYFPGSICEDASGRRDFCGPESLNGTSDRLFRNVTGDLRRQAKEAGDATTASTNVAFSDVTVSSGIAKKLGKGLGVLSRDFNGDGYPDIFVANDGEENALWVQYPGGLFSNEALLRGVALNRSGEAEANMGVVADDFNRDSLSDLFVTHLRNESHTLFQGVAPGQFMDRTVESGFSVSSLPFTGFGVQSVDFDHDGDLDLAISNGGVKRGPTSDSQDVEPFWRDYAQRNELYLNKGKGEFIMQQSLGGSDFARKVEVSRALVGLDFDRDGDMDLLLTNCAGPARLYRNDFPKLGHWLKVKVVDPDLKRDALGAQVLVIAGKNVFARELATSGSYLSGSEFVIHFGLGEVDRIDQVKVFWPSGSMDIEDFTVSGVDQAITLTRGTGRVVARPK